MDRNHLRLPWHTCSRSGNKQCHCIEKCNRAEACEWSFAVYGMLITYLVSAIKFWMKTCKWFHTKTHIVALCYFLFFFFYYWFCTFLHSTIRLCKLFWYFSVRAYKIFYIHTYNILTIEGFHVRHIKPILQVIILTTTMLVSSLYGAVLKNTTKCPITFYLVHTAKPNYNWVTVYSSTHTRLKF